MDYSEMTLRLVLSVLLGGIIGFERQAAHKPAGLRTNILVCLGSAVFMLIALKAREDFPESLADPTRIAAGVITGIGFLGAGTILRGEHDVLGLTSAATIWLVCGIGMAIGVGYYALAGVATLLGLVILKLIAVLEMRFKGS